MLKEVRHRGYTCCISFHVHKNCESGKTNICLLGQDGGTFGGEGRDRYQEKVHGGLLECGDIYFSIWMVCSLYINSLSYTIMICTVFLYLY